MDNTNIAVSINRTEDFQKIAQQLSEFVAGLPLDQPTNDRLVALMVEQLNIAEKDAYLQGVDIGVKVANGCPRFDGKLKKPVS